MPANGLLAKGFLARGLLANSFLAQGFPAEGLPATDLPTEALPLHTLRMPKKNSNPDFIVIGAGAAGLSAAIELAAAGQSVHIIEARDRIGGRILTRHDPDVPIPIELGAEFIHGAAPAIMEWLARSNQSHCDASQSRWRSINGQLSSAKDVFENMKRGLASIKRPKSDLPFAAFLDRFAGRHLSKSSRAFARMLVEGFDAADSTRVSTLEILDEWGGTSAADAPTFRPTNGYAALISALAAALPRDRTQLHLNTVAQDILWQPGRVQVNATRLGMPVELIAPRVVITLPLGVLQMPPHLPGGVRFEPVLKQKQRALSQLASGPVIKVILKFDCAFWETLDEGKYRNGAFFQAPGRPFPTFWTSLPVRSSTLVAWTAGPNAANLAGKSQQEIIGLALECVSDIFGRRAPVSKRLIGAYLHDWQADPFACGAYSYVIAGGRGARKRLAQPIADTLFFAGEATDFEGEAATVSGALHSGKRTAQFALRASSDAQRNDKRK